MNYAAAGCLKTAAASCIAVLQLQWAQVDPVGLQDIALTAVRKVITAGLSGIAERTPTGTFSR